jgi:hypothetical protein
LAEAAPGQRRRPSTSAQATNAGPCRCPP